MTICQRCGGIGGAHRSHCPWHVERVRAARPHRVTIRLEYVDNKRGGRTPWKRRGRCTCGWQCLSWDGLRPILIADEHVREATR